MRVLILNQFFYPDISATSQLMTDLAEDLQASGMEVTALAGRDRYDGARALPARAEHRGIHIRRIRCLRFDRGSGLRRILSYLSFHASAWFWLMTHRKQDVIVALTTPPLIAATARAAAALRGSRLVCLVQDLYPEVAVELGALRADSPATRGLRRLSHAVMRSADAVIVLGECMRQRVEAAGVAPENVHVLTNWMDRDIVPPASPVNAFAVEQGLVGKFAVVYSGNMGRAHDLDTILLAAERLRERQDIEFVFIGDGPRRAYVEDFVQRHALQARLLPYVERNRLAETLTLPGAGLISLAPTLSGLVVPSKLYGLMAAAQACLLVGPADSETARTIKKFDCGFVIANGDAETLAMRIAQLAADSSLRSAMGQRARAAFEQYFERRVVTAQYRKLLMTLAGKRQGQATL